MAENFDLDANMTVMRGAVPIRFAHHRGPDKPENHRLHINNYVEIYFYIRGDHRYIVEDSLYEMRRGDVIVISPREVHKALLTGEVEDYERFYFLVDPSSFSGMAFDPMAALRERRACEGNLISFDDETREVVIGMLYAIGECFENGRNDQLRALSYFFRILDECAGTAYSRRKSAEASARTPELLAKILAYISANTSRIDSVTEMAAELGLTPQYLSSYFSKHIGTPLKTYIQAKKITLAKDLLDRGADVTTACYECGFNECSYFIRVFRKYVGMTPRKYRESAVEVR